VLGIRSELHYTASGIITPMGGRLVHSLREDWLECMGLWVRRQVHVTPNPQSHAFQPVLSQAVHETATHRCDDTRGCVMQFRPDDEHMCSKHVEA